MARILVIDDEGGIRRVLHAALALGGHEVLEAASGKEALKMHAATPADLVITDINMPETDGIEVINALRRGHPRPRVIVMSAGGGPLKDEVFHVANLLGAYATLAKPFSLDSMMKAVEKALAA